MPTLVPAGRPVRPARCSASPRTSQSCRKSQLLDSGRVRDPARGTRARTACGRAAPPHPAPHALHDLGRGRARGRHGGQHGLVPLARLALHGRADLHLAPPPQGLRLRGWLRAHAALHGGGAVAAAALATDSWEPRATCARNWLSTQPPSDMETAWLLQTVCLLHMGGGA